MYNYKSTFCLVLIYLLQINLVRISVLKWLLLKCHHWLMREAVYITNMRITDICMNYTFDSSLSNVCIYIWTLNNRSSSCNCFFISLMKNISCIISRMLTVWNQCDGDNPLQIWVIVQIITQNIERPLFHMFCMHFNDNVIFFLDWCVWTDFWVVFKRTKLNRQSKQKKQGRKSS